MTEAKLYELAKKTLTMIAKLSEDTDLPHFSPSAEFEAASKLGPVILSELIALERTKSGRQP